MVVIYHTVVVLRGTYMYLLSVYTVAYAYFSVYPKIYAPVWGQVPDKCT